MFEVVVEEFEVDVNDLIMDGCGNIYVKGVLSWLIIVEVMVIVV